VADTPSGLAAGQSASGTSLQFESKQETRGQYGSPSLAFWKRITWTRDSILSCTAEALLGFPYYIWFGDEDAKKEK